MKAVLDLGTNTFHLLIGEIKNGSVVFIRREYRAVKLGEGGINKKLISADAFERGRATLREYREIIAKYPVDEILAFATSAIRSADNGAGFCQKVYDETGIVIDTINGEKEADFIFAGMQLSGSMDDATGLVMDIGGGSVEFIICTKTKLLWKQSFEVGAARLMDLFHHSDPVSTDDKTAIEKYLNKELADAFFAIEKYKPQYLVGSAGAFETYTELILLDKNQCFVYEETPRFDFKKPDLDAVLKSLIQSNHQERMQKKGLIPLRVDMIVVASVFSRYILKKTGIKDVRLSTYSLKEGAFQTLFNKA